MATRRLAVLIVSAACSGPAVQDPPTGPEAEARWWCVYSVDRYASHCERTQSECERVRNRVLRSEGPCTPESAAHCFRYVSKGFAMSDTVVLSCAGEQSHCNDRRARVFESEQGHRMLGDCEVVD